MKKIYAAIAALTLSSATFADNVTDNPLMLRPMHGDKSPDIEATINVYGSCGGTVVAVISAKHESLKLGTLSFSDGGGAGDVVIRTGKKDISLHKYLSDYNFVHCVSSKAGDRLVIGSTCGGSSCTDSMNYKVIDPSTTEIKPKSDKPCDGECANKLLGFRYFK